MEKNQPRYVSANILKLHERVVASLETLDGGGGKELAKNSAENLVNIDKVEVLSDNDKKGRLLDGELGRKIFSGLERMVQIAGKEAKLVISTNFNILEYFTNSKNELSNMEKEIENLDSRMLEKDVSKPDKEDFLLNAEVLIKKMEKGMRDDFIRTKDESDPNTTLISDVGPTTRKKGETVSMESKNEFIIEEQRKTDLELEISNRKDNIELEWKERYLEALSEYQMYQKELKDIEKRKKILKTEQEKKLILNIHVQGILSGLSIIVTKIKNAAQSSHKIRGILEGQVKLDMTGERIHNSYDNNNVSEMYQALYGKANFVTFTNDLLSTMSINIERDTAKSNPMKAVQKTEVIFATWEVMGYWRYMSKDIFWTGILLNSFPKSTGDNDIRDRLIFETNNFIRTHEPDERSTLDGEMPIYDHLRDYIKTIQDSMQMRTSRSQYLTCL